MPEPIEIQLKKGVLGLCVLALLAREDSYAYEIASRLSDAIDMAGHQALQGQGREWRRFADAVDSLVAGDATTAPETPDTQKGGDA